MPARKNECSVKAPLKKSENCINCRFGSSRNFAAYARFESKLTDWQKSREIDIQKNTGSTKFKAHIDALTIGGLAFCATSGIIIIAARTRTMFLAKKRDGEKHL